MKLDHMAPLLLPWVQDPWGMLRPPLSVEALQMSCALAGATYGMEIEPWMEAGWQDVTIHVDGELTVIRPADGWLHNRWKKHRVRSRIRQRNPFGQVLGALRQVDRSDTGKAVVMLHPAPEGRWVLAVSFMGTGTRFYDWISNFRMTTENGMHKGFLQLTRQFEAQEDLIEFPQAARELGLDKLTLHQVLSEMKHPNSRFQLWLSGHSQGAALMQIYAHCKIHEDGLLPQHIVGYGFASPTVMTGTAVDKPAAYPLYHILNEEDVITRCGAAVHLGVCLNYPTDKILRDRCYAWPVDMASICARKVVEPIVARMQDSATGIEALVAYLNVISRCSAADILAVLGLGDSILPLKHVVAAADVDALVRSVSRHAAAAYQSVTGRPLDRARVAEVAGAIEDATALVGIRAFADALVQLIRYPHSIAEHFPGGYEGSYRYIAAHGLDKLEPFIWLAGDEPVKLTAVTDAPRIAQGEVLEGLHVRRVERPARRVHRNIRYRDPRPRTDTRHHTPELQLGAVRPGERAVRMK